MNTQYFAHKGQKPCISSVGQRPTAFRRNK
jgi:hypothetical protein